eukprot:6205037-Pleurochrysis_carterae.AAC.1
MDQAWIRWIGGGMPSGTLDPLILRLKVTLQHASDCLHANEGPRKSRRQLLLQPSLWCSACQ